MIWAARRLVSWVRSRLYGASEEEMVRAGNPTVVRIPLRCLVFRAAHQHGPDLSALISREVCAHVDGDGLGPVLGQAVALLHHPVHLASGHAHARVLIHVLIRCVMDARVEGSASRRTVVLARQADRDEARPGRAALETTADGTAGYGGPPMAKPLEMAADDRRDGRLGRRK